MSSSSLPPTKELLGYVAGHAAGDDPFLDDLKRAALEAGLPRIWIAPEQAAFIQVLLELAGAREVVEVGTLGGYSAIRMARALPPEGRVRTIEVSPEHAAFARTWIARSDVSSRVEVIEGPAADVLPRFPDGGVDAVFVDADKEGYARYRSEALRMLRPGGLLLVDNAFGFGRVLEDSDDPDVRAIRAFNDTMPEELRGVIVPLGDGLWVAVKARRGRRR